MGLDFIRTKKNSFKKQRDGGRAALLVADQLFEGTSEFEEQHVLFEVHPGFKLVVGEELVVQSLDASLVALRGMQVVATADHPPDNVLTRPHIPMLQLNNTRQGFFERPQFDAILEQAPGFLHAPLTFAFITGWRFKSEVMPLTVAHVDLVAGVVRLEPGKRRTERGATST